MAIKQTRVCRYCKEKGFMDEMELEEVENKSKVLKKFYHKDCYIKHLEEKMFKELEIQELDSLRLTIQDIYDIKELPHQAYPLLQKLRNGERVFGGQKTGKRYKMGYPYSLIEKTYKYCNDTIIYWNGVKDFDGFMNAFKYGLSIIIDKIYIVEQNELNKKKQEDVIDMRLEKTNVDDVFFESNYKKMNNENDDITDFLDD